MQRLPFKIPDFTRVIWNSEDSRQVWEPRISAINKAWLEVEREAVCRGARPGALLFVPVAELPTVVMWAANRKLAAIPLSIEGDNSATYAASSAQYVPGLPGKYRVALCKPEDTNKWLGANDEQIGKLLGFPDCCAAFFQRVWVDEQKIDTTWDMARGGTEGPVACNILLRWLGVRLVPHLPCGFNCEATFMFADRLCQVWRDLGYQEELGWAIEMLSWPMQWTALHGIAEIQTPVCTIAARTDATAQKEVVAKQGTRYPDEGSLGLKFPYRIMKDKATGSPSFKRSLSSIAELNGFGSVESMDKSHDVLLRVLPDGPGKLLDLGCGTGRLLEKAQLRGWDVHGVEFDNARAGAGKLAIRRGNIFDLNTWQGEWDLVIFMPGRLKETTPELAAAFRIALRQRAKRVLMYTYADWLKQPGSLLTLVGETFGTEWWGKYIAEEGGVEAALFEPAPTPMAATS